MEWKPFLHIIFIHFSFNHVKVQFVLFVSIVCIFSLYFWVRACMCVCAYVKNSQWALPMNTVAEPSKFEKECNGTVSLSDRNATKQGSWFNKLHFWTSKLFSPEFFVVTLDPRTRDQRRLTKRLFSSIKMHKQYNFT